MTLNAYTVLSCLIGRAQREDGQTMAEYGILIAVIAIVVVVAAVVLGGNISSTLFGPAARAL